MALSISLRRWSFGTRSSMLTTCICSLFLSVLEVIIEVIPIPFDTSIIPEKVPKTQIITGFVALLKEKSTADAVDFVYSLKCGSHQGNHILLYSRIGQDNYLLQIRPHFVPVYTILFRCFHERFRRLQLSYSLHG